MKQLLVGLLLGCGAAACGRRAADSSVRTTTPSAASASVRARESVHLEYGDPSDIEQWLGQNGVTVKLAECDNVRIQGAVTRGLSCTTKLNPDQVRTLGKAFALDAKAVREARPEETGHCVQRSAFSQGAIDRRGASWGCGPPDRGFAYLEIHVAATGEACIETEYNWSC